MSAQEAAIRAAGPEGGEKRPSIDFAWFRRRQWIAIGSVIAIVLVFEGCSLISNFDLGYALVSIPTAFAWMFTHFMPTADSLTNLPLILEQTFSTVLDSVAATVLSAIIGIILAVLGSSSIGVSFAPVRGVIRFIASVFRNIPMIAWALLLLLSFKQSEFTGFLALFLTTLGQLTRFFLDTFDEIPTGPVEALRACGASYWQVVFQAGFPLAESELMSWMLYMAETNIRSATLIGLLTGTGIGFVFNLYYTSFRYDNAGLVVFVTIVVVLLVEAISNKARRSMI
jgi:phosphonate transport system permease protein